MKKVIVTLLMSAFTLGTYVATASPVMQHDTTKKSKRDSLKKDTSSKKPKPIQK